MHPTRTATVLLLLLSSIPLGHAQETIYANALEEIHVTENCRIFHKNTADQKARYFRNSGICHQESKYDVVHPEAELEHGVLTKVVYEINESDYLLHNFLDHPVAFILDQPLPDGWHVDSDPQPLTTNNHLAIYRVLAQPGQTVRLHTGQKRQVGSRAGK